MTRLVALDTETTGLFDKQGDRVVEIALVEVTRDPNPAFFHSLFDPEGREISPEAVEIHGHTAEFLIGKPLFRDRIPEMLDFIGDSTLVIHNAPFDVGFLREEFMLAGQIWPEPPVIDTLKEAIKENFGRHSLDALCSRFGIDATERVKHGALIDTQLLSKVYLAWKGQAGLDFAPMMAKRAIVDGDKLSAMNSASVTVPSAVKATLPSANWAKHFDGIEL